MNKGKSCFANYHCSTMDCPNIQYDAVDEQWGYGIADDCGMERIKCKDCYYNSGQCEDCYFYSFDEEARKEYCENDT